MTTIHTHHQRAKRRQRRLFVKQLPPIAVPTRTLFNSRDSKLFMGKEFSLGDVLSITTGRLLSERRIDGVYDILNWMTGDDLFTHQLPRAGKACQPWLVEQYPQLDPKQSPKLQTMLDKLTAMLDRESPEVRNGMEISYLIRGWLSSIGMNFWGLSSNDMLIVYPLAAKWGEWYESKDPMEELIKMVGADRVVGIQLPPSEDISQTTIG